MVAVDLLWDLSVWEQWLSHGLPGLKHCLVLYMSQILDCTRSPLLEVGGQHMRLAELACGMGW